MGVQPILRLIRHTGVFLIVERCAAAIERGRTRNRSGPHRRRSAEFGDVMDVRGRYTELPGEAGYFASLWWRDPEQRNALSAGMYAFRQPCGRRSGQQCVRRRPVQYVHNVRTAHKKVCAEKRLPRFPAAVRHSVRKGMGRCA